MILENKNALNKLIDEILNKFGDFVELTERNKIKSTDIARMEGLMCQNYN